MKRSSIFTALLILILPILARGLWFYRGLPQRGEIATPDFESFAAPEAPLNKTAAKANTASEATGGIVLLDTIHLNQFNPNEIDALTSAIQERGGRMESYIDSTQLEYQLKYASAFITVSPSVPFSTNEQQTLKKFADRGGRILAFTDATRNFIYYDSTSGNPLAYGDSESANSLLSAFDITVNNDYLYNTEKNEGNFRNVLFDEFSKSELTFGLKEVALYGTHSVESLSGMILLRGMESTLSSGTDAHDFSQGGAALSADGNVAAFGDFTFLTSPYNSYTDNATLIANLADFILAGSRNTSLQSFPFVFKEKSVQVFLTSEVTKTTELVTALSGLQTSLRAMGIEIEFTDIRPRSGDAIVIGSFAPMDEIEPYAKKFDVTLGDGDFITTAEYGDVGRYGTGILLFDASDKGNTLVLLADTPEDINSLISVISNGSLSACLTGESVAVCSVGVGGDYSSESTDGEATDEATPEATPTPSG